MLSDIHFLLTYACNYECDHCFLYCSPNSKGTFTLAQVKGVLEEAKKINTIECVYFEGGEPFLYYPIMVEGLKMANKMGFKTGIVTNSYWATSIEDALIWLKPFSDLGITYLDISDDTFHFEDEETNLAKNARKAANVLNLPSSSITIDKPTMDEGIVKDHEKGTPVIKGGAMFRGRAAETLVEGLPKREWESLNKCPYEDLEGLGRVHLDPFGNVHICQGLSIGNFWETALSKLVKKYNAHNHPICGPLIRGGPAQLVKEYQIEHDNEYVDECHLCYMVRLKLLDRFPKYLNPKQVYGLE
ncbi:MAG: radical SAM protein [Candidatus Thorarchaeota archaeon]